METSYSFLTNYESYSINYATDKFLEKEDDDLFLFSTSTFIEENIEKVWQVMSEPFYLSYLSKKNIGKFNVKKQFSSCSIGDTYSFYWIGVTRIRGNCIKISEKENVKKIIWNISTSIDIYYKKTILVCKINEGKTLVKIILSTLKNKINDAINFDCFKNYFQEIYHKILSYLKNYILLRKNKTSHESFIINKSNVEVWERLIDIGKISDLLSKIGIKLILKNEKFIKGNFIKCLINNKTKCYFIIKEIKKSKKQNLWSFTIETFGVNKKIIKQEIIISVTKIDENKSQVAVRQLCKNNIIIDKKFNYKNRLIDIVKLLKENFLL